MGQNGGHLTEKGFVQMKKTAEALKDEKINYIYYSSMKRTKEMMKEIARFHPKSKIKSEKLLWERNFGKLTGTDKGDKIEKSMGYEKFMKYRPEGGESGLEVRERTIRFYEKILRKHEKDTVLVVSHAGNIIEMIFYIMNWGSERYEKAKPKNAAITILEIDKNRKCRIEKLNSLEHLS